MCLMEKNPHVPVHQAGITEILLELPVEVCLFLKCISVCLHVCMYACCCRSQKKILGTGVTPSMWVLGTERAASAEPVFGPFHCCCFDVLGVELRALWHWPLFQSPSFFICCCYFLFNTWVELRL